MLRRALHGLAALGAPRCRKRTPMSRAAIFWRIAMAQMAALNALAADHRKWAMLPDWRRRERRALAEAGLNNYFNEIERIIAEGRRPARSGQPYDSWTQRRDWLPGGFEDELGFAANMARPNSIVGPSC